MCINCFGPVGQGSTKYAPRAPNRYIYIYIYIYTCIYGYRRHIGVRELRHSGRGEATEAERLRQRLQHHHHHHQHHRQLHHQMLSSMTVTCVDNRKHLSVDAIVSEHHMCTTPKPISTLAS